MRKFISHFSPALLSMGLAVVINQAASANAGDLDSGFGAGGKVVTSIGQNMGPRDAALQGDGKLLVAGVFDNFQIATQVFGLVRYLPNGRLDLNFGHHGAAKTAFTNFINTANAITVQSTGKIVLAGEASSADGSLDVFALARYQATGVLDSGFGHNGKVTTDFLHLHGGGFHQAADVVITQPDGKILVGGVVTPNPDRPPETALARYNDNGSLDTSFGRGGKVAVVAIGNINALALLADGQILALNGAGGIAQFSSSGVYVPLTGGTVVATAHTGVTSFQANGKFVLAGVAQGKSGENDIDVKMSRFLEGGGPDPGFFNSPPFDFGTGGPFTNFPQAVAIQTDGQVVVGGGSQTASFGDIFGVARLNPDGSLDSSFGAGGKLTTRFSGTDLVWAIVLQPDGKIIAVGQTLDRTTNLANFALARYLGH